MFVAYTRFFLDKCSITHVQVTVHVNTFISRSWWIMLKYLPTFILTSFSCFAFHSTYFSFQCTYFSRACMQIVIIVKHVPLKHTAASIAPSVTKLFNLSIKSGRVPRAWKVSTVVPIAKSARSHSSDNYRPISLLCVLSKVLEKHIHTLIFNHLKQYYPLSDSQWGFRSGRSTVPALLLTIHHWLQLLVGIRTGYLCCLPGLSKGI